MIRNSVVKFWDKYFVDSGVAILDVRHLLGVNLIVNLGMKSEVYLGMKMEVKLEVSL